VARGTTGHTRSQIRTAMNINTAKTSHVASVVGMFTYEEKVSTVMTTLEVSMLVEESPRGSSRPAFLLCENTLLYLYVAK
jgi:uncharacterized Fe-S cluster-containing protein